MRSNLLSIVASMGEDPGAIEEAKAITAKSLADPASVDATVAKTALFTAADFGDANFFDQLQKLSATADNPQIRSTALFALAVFRDPALARRALDFAVSGQVRNQDAFILFTIELQSRDNQNMAWEYIQKNWDKVIAQVTITSGAGLVEATGSFCSAEKLDQVTTFFNSHKVPASEHALARAKDQISDCIDLRAAQEPNLKAWLSKQ
jgi:aminopeptidase N/puromycin-sensitive aminopeptidase